MIDSADYKSFYSFQEAEEWGKLHYNKWAQNYKKTMPLASDIMRDRSVASAPLEFYCGHCYRDMNSYLRNGPAVSYRCQAVTLCDVLIVSLCHAPRVPEQIVVYRLVCDEFIQKLLADNKAGTYTTEFGFLSTSLLANIIDHTEEQYSKHNSLLKIYVPRGTVGIYVNSVTARVEQEMLFAPRRGLALVAPPYFDTDIGKNVFECRLINMEVV